VIAELTANGFLANIARAPRIAKHVKKSSLIRTLKSVLD